ncbi:hypothetical protein BST16_14000 [Mycobacterium asiaticum DSM 44297]|nr:hypothetical protein BST16_14000 [Mycobacterium asiaticum DSM 44297]
MASVGELVIGEFSLDCGVVAIAVAMADADNSPRFTVAVKDDSTVTAAVAPVARRHALGSVGFVGHIVG